MLGFLFLCTFVVSVLGDCVLYSEFGVDLGTIDNDFTHFYYCCHEVDMAFLGTVCVECCSFPLYPILIALGVIIFACCGFALCCCCLSKKKSQQPFYVQTYGAVPEGYSQQQSPNYVYQ